MSRYIKPRYKCLIKLRDNIWNNSKPLRFKRQKWKNIRRVLLRRFNYKSRKRRISVFFFKRIRMWNFYRMRLNMWKTFYSIYGKFKKQQFSKLIKNSVGFGISLKIKNILYNEPVLGNKSFDNLLYIMWVFESKLISSIFRMGIFRSIQSTLHYIKQGGILVNSKIIKNPFYSLNENDIISLNPAFAYPIAKSSMLFLLKKKNRKMFKKLPGVHITKSKHLLYCYSNFKYIYVQKPVTSDLDKFTKINWDYIFYLLKLKRK